MITNLLSALLLFFIQPTFLVGIIVAILLSVRRKKQERKLFRVAINKDSHEIKDYFLKGLLPGLISSILVVAAGIPITIEAVIIYQLLVLLAFIIGGHFIHPIFTIPLTAFILWGANKIGLWEQLPNPAKNWYEGFAQNEWINSSLIQNLLIITLILLFLTVVQLMKQKEKNYSPKMIETKRGKKIAAYQLTPFWVIPLVLIIPGEAFTDLFEWWPVFSIGESSYSFLILPILSGFKYTVRSHVPREATVKLAKDLLVVAIFSALCLAGAYWIPLLTYIGTAIVFLGGIAVYIRHTLREKNGRQLYAPANEGLKVIGVRPDTPAEKMELQIGETVVMCNEIPIETEEDFHEALSKNSVYCRLKVKDTKGEPRLTETALYADDPHGLGIVFLP